MSNEPCHKKEIQKLRVLKERGQGNHAQQVRKFESALKEAKHNLRGRNTTIPGATSDSHVIILHQCQTRGLKRPTQGTQSFHQIFIDHLNRTNTEKTLMQTSIELFVRGIVITKSEILVQLIQKAILKAKLWII